MLYEVITPVSQLEVLLGKFIGAALALLAALVLGFGISGLTIGWRAGTAEADTFLILLGFSFLLGMATLSLGFLISAASKKSATAIGLAIFTWLVLVFFGDLGLMGSAIVMKLRIGELFTLAMLNPL